MTRHSDKVYLRHMLDNVRTVASDFPSLAGILERLVE